MASTRHEYPHVAGAEKAFPKRGSPLSGCLPELKNATRPMTSVICPSGDGTRSVSQATLENVIFTQVWPSGPPTKRQNLAGRSSPVATSPRPQVNRDRYAPQHLGAHALLRKIPLTGVPIGCSTGALVTGSPCRQEMAAARRRALSRGELRQGLSRRM
jgi:hypothetical protein